MSRASPVLLIHGIDDTEALFRKMRHYLQRHGRDVHSINLVPNNGDAGLDKLAQQVVACVEPRFRDGETIDLIGFSMGGLVARYYVQRLGGLKRVRRFVTISSPHKGTFTAFLRRNEGARQMRPGSPFLCDLDPDMEMLERLSFTSIWTPFDLMIVPAHSSELSAGRTIRVEVAAHPLMVSSPRVLKLVLEALTAGEQVTPSQAGSDGNPEL